MNLGFRHLSNEQSENRATLAEGVKGIRCTHSDHIVILKEQGVLNDRQLQALASMENALLRTPTTYVGTVEVYANGAMNVYLKEDGVVIGYCIIR